MFSIQDLADLTQHMPEEFSMNFCVYADTVQITVSPTCTKYDPETGKPTIKTRFVSFLRETGDIYVPVHGNEKETADMIAGWIKEMKGE